MNNSNKRITRKTKAAQTDKASRRVSSKSKSKKTSEPKVQSGRKSRRDSSISPKGSKSRENKSPSPARRKSARSKNKGNAAKDLSPNTPPSSAKKRSLSKKKGNDSNSKEISPANLRRSTRNSSISAKIPEQTQDNQNTRRASTRGKRKSTSKNKQNQKNANADNKRKADKISREVNHEEETEEANQNIAATSTKRVKLNSQKEEVKENDEKIEINLSSNQTSSRRGRKKSEAINVDNEAQDLEDQGIRRKVRGVRGKMNVEKESEKKIVTSRLLELNINIQSKNYSIWRKILVSEEVPFSKFARIIVTSFGWLGYWDWLFKVQDKEIICPPDDEENREKNRDSKHYGDELNLKHFNLKAGDKLDFIYNLEDPWTHQITIEGANEIDMTKINDLDDEKKSAIEHARVSNGSMAVPPDNMTKDQYEKAFDDYNKGDKELTSWKKRFGENFNLTKFDRNKVNEILKMYMYDESKIDAGIKEADIIFKW